MEERSGGPRPAHGFSRRLLQLGRANLERQLAHPTVRGIGDGTLDEERFRAWLVQDYLFLLDYVRLFALAAARAPDAETLGRQSARRQSAAQLGVAPHAGQQRGHDLGEVAGGRGP